MDQATARASRGDFMSMTRSLGTGVMWLRSPMRVPSFGVLVIRILLFRVLS